MNTFRQVTPAMWRRTVGVLVTAGLVTGIAGQPAYAHAKAKQPSGTTIRAVIWPNHVVTVAPKAVRRGTIVLTVKNRDTAPQQLQINGVESRLIEPGGSAAMRVTFTKPGYYSIALPDQAQSYASDYARNATRIKITG